jgi:hypothetical protein
MTGKPFHAFYFNEADHSRPPARTEVIEAQNERDAAKVAASHLGHCKRVDVEGPRWEPESVQVILADRYGGDSEAA